MEVQGTRHASLAARGLLLLGVVLFAVALPLAFETDARDSPPTWWKLLTGWLFVLTLETTVWLSFPVLFAAWIFLALGRRRTGLALSAFALLNALPFLAGPELRYGWGDSIRSLRQAPGPGYFVMLGSMAATTASAIARFDLDRIARGLWARRFPLGVSFVAVVLSLLAIRALPGAINRVEAVVYDFFPALAPANRHKPYQDAPVDTSADAARFEAAGWSAVGFPPHVMEAIEHAPPGTPPEWLRVEQRRQELVIASTHREPVSVEAWFTYEHPAGVSLACRYELHKQMIDGRVLKLAPGESGSIRLTTYQKPFVGFCVKLDGRVPLEFLVRAQSDGRPLFVSDSLLEPAPPQAPVRVRIAPF